MSTLNHVNSAKIVGIKPTAPGYHVDSGQYEIRRHDGTLVARVEVPRYGSLACYHDYLRNDGQRGWTYTMIDKSGAVVATQDGYTHKQSGLFVGC